MVKIITLICVGNTCRSPMAAAILQKTLGEEFLCNSAGMSVVQNNISKNGKIAALNYGFSIIQDQTNQVDKVIIEKADLILCLGDKIFDDLINSYPKYRDKFLKYAPKIPKVPDPSDLEGFSQNQIEAGNLSKGCLEAYEILAKMMINELTPALIKTLKQKGFYKK